MFNKLNYYKNLSIFFIIAYFDNIKIKLPSFIFYLGYFLFVLELIYPMDFFTFFHPEPSTNTQNSIITIIIGGIAVIGIISSLFWTTFSSIHTTKFINAAENIRNLYQKLIPYSQSILNVAFFIIYSIILICYFITGNNNNHFFIQWILLLIFIIIYFSLLSYLAIYYSNNLNMQKLLINNIYKSFNRLIYKSFQDNKFQEKIKQATLENVNCLKSFWEADKNLQSGQLTNNLYNYLLQNNNIIEAYWNIKEKIYYKSNWYDRQNVFSSVYHIEQDHINTHREIIYDNFEIFILSNNLEFINIFFKKNEFEKVNNYIILCHNLCKVNINPTEFCLLLQIANYLKNKIIEKYNEESAKNQLNDFFMLLNNIILFYELIIEICLREIKKEYQYDINTIDFNKLDEEIRNNYLLNNYIGENLVKKIKIELQIENKIITPNKYINNILSNKKYNETIEVLKRIFICFDSIKDFKDNFKGNSLLYYSVCYVILKIKRVCYGQQSELKKIIQQFRKQNSFLNINQVNENNEQVTKLIRFDRNFFQELIHELPKYNLEQSTIFGKPDLLGYIYKEYCLILIELVNNADEDNFICVYEYFLDFIIFYFNFLDKKVSEQIENSELIKSYLNEFEPFWVFFQLTGFADSKLTNLHDTIFNILTNEKHKKIISSVIKIYKNQAIPESITYKLNHFLFIDHPEFIINNYLLNIIDLLKEHYAI